MKSSAKNQKKPRKLWAFWANRTGPWYNEPKPVIYCEALDSWWWQRHHDVELEGLQFDDGYLCFAHRDKAEVDKFIAGFMACRGLLSGFFNDK